MKLTFIEKEQYIMWLMIIVELVLFIWNSVDFVKNYVTINACYITVLRGMETIKCTKLLSKEHLSELSKNV